MTALEVDERAAVRAFLQRAEVRLSTMHRVASALLSGAGLMVVLPAIAKDSLVTVLRALIEADLDPAHLCLLAAMAALLALPFAALWLVVRDLTVFYFHAQHVAHAGADAFTPRFTLTSLRLPTDELDDAARRQLLARRNDPGAVELLVPSNEVARERIDRQLDAYGGLGRREQPGDLGRAQGLFELAASRDRTLLEEVAKVEHGMARHVLRLQMIVLRYVKALLAFLATVLAVFAAAAVLDGAPAVGPTQELWLVCITALWAPTLVAVTSSPVRWLDELLRAEGARRSAAADDPELTRVERIVVWVAGTSWSLVAAALAALVVAGDGSHRGMAAAAAVTAVGGALLWAQVVARARAVRAGAG